MVNRFIVCRPLHAGWVQEKQINGVMVCHGSLNLYSLGSLNVPFEHAFRANYTIERLLP